MTIQYCVYLPMALHHMVLGYLQAQTLITKPGSCLWKIRMLERLRPISLPFFLCHISEKHRFCNIYKHDLTRKSWADADSIDPILGQFLAHNVMFTGIILCMHPGNERRCYNVTFLIGWVDTHTTPCVYRVFAWYLPWTYSNNNLLW